MSLTNKTCWVVGGVGVIGRGITRALLKSGATVIVNSRSVSRLESMSADLDHPDRLITIHGSLLPGFATKTVTNTLSSVPLLDHVVAHGAVRYWSYTKLGGGYDETHSIQQTGGGNFLSSMTAEEFSLPSSHLASLHFSAAQELVPRLQFSTGCSSYTLVTGDGGGHPDGKRSAFGEINSHHMWGLSAALRNDSLEGINFREIRVGMEVNRPLPVRETDPRMRPLSEDVGALCAGLAENAEGKEDSGSLLTISDQDKLAQLLEDYSCK